MWSQVANSSQVTIALNIVTRDGYVRRLRRGRAVRAYAVGALGFSLGSGYSVELVQVTEETDSSRLWCSADRSHVRRDTRLCTP